jgi:hypothetical protein
MNESRWEQIKRIFNAAMERPAAERLAFIEQACGDDADLRREVVEVLAEWRGMPTGNFPDWFELDDADYVDLLNEVDRRRRGPSPDDADAIDD